MGHPLRSPLRFGHRSLVVLGVLGVWAGSAGSVAGAATGNASTISAAEGAAFNGPVATFSGAVRCPCSAEIAWGDGSSSTGTIADQGIEHTISGTHVYAEGGTYPVRVSYSHADQPTSPDSVLGSAQVADAPLSVAAEPISAVAGRSFGAEVARFTDADPRGRAARYVAAVNWGDGTSGPATVVPHGHAFAVNAWHRFRAPGAPVIEVTVSDGHASGASRSPAGVVATRRARVYVPPLVLSSVRPRRGQRITLSLRSTTRAVSAAQASALGPGSVFTWRFGDGRPVPERLGQLEFAGPEPTAHAAAAHVFTRPGRYSLEADVTEPDGGQTSFVTQVSVGCPANGTLARMASASCPAPSDLPADAAINTTGDLWAGGTLTFKSYIGVTTANVKAYQLVPSPGQQGSNPGNPAFGQPQGQLGGTFGGPYTYTWDWGDGSPPASNDGSALEHSYAAPGQFTVTLTVADAAGNTLVLHRALTITVPPVCGPFPVLGLTAMPVSGCAVPVAWVEPGHLIYETTHGFLINGVGFSNDTYHGGDPVYLDATTGSVFSFVHGTGTGLMVSFGKITIADGPAFSLAHGTDGLDLPLDPATSFQSKFLTASRTIAGLRLTGGDLIMRDDGPTTIENASVALSSPLAGAAPTPPLGDDVTADPEHAALSLPPIPHVTLGGLDLGDVAFTHDSAGAWTGSLSFTLPGGAGIDMAPPKPHGIGLTPSGKFDYAGGAATFPDNAVPVGPDAFYLKQIDFHVLTDPTSFQGTVSLRTPIEFFGRPLAEIQGCFALVFAASTDQGTAPFCDHSFTAAGAGQALRVHGSLKVLGVDFGNGYLEYRLPANHLSAGGAVDYDVGGLGLLRVSGALGLEFASLSQWSALAQLTVHQTIVGDSDLGSIGVLVSSNGIAGCGSVLGASVGGYYLWSGAHHFGAYACDVDTSPAAVGAGVARAASGTAVAVHAGPPFALLEIAGRTSAPRVELTGSRGEHASDSGATVQRLRGLQIIHSDRLRITYVRIDRPRDEVWTVRPQPGSSVITSVDRESGLPRPSVRATLSRRSGRWLLRYAIRGIPRQRVTFLERGRGDGKVIGIANGISGSLRFTPGAGPPGRRTVLALVEQDRIPRAEITLASFVVKRGRALSAPRGLIIARRRRVVSIHWRAVAGAREYEVAVAGAHSTILRASTRLRTVTLPASRLPDGGRVRVRGVDVLGFGGHAATATLAPRQPARHRVRV